MVTKTTAEDKETTLLDMICEKHMVRPKLPFGLHQHQHSETLGRGGGRGGGGGAGGQEATLRGGGGGVQAVYSTVTISVAGMQNST